MQKLFLFILFLVLGCDGPFFEIPAEADTTAPLIVITSPASGSTLSDTVQISLYASDNDAVKNIELYINDSLVKDSLQDPYYYLWDTKNYKEDIDHFIQAKAIDYAGNTNQTLPTRITVNNKDNINPNGSLLYPFSGQILNNVVNILVNATDNDSIRSVSFYINNDTVSTCFLKPFLHSWDTNNEVDDYFYVISAKIEDMSGNYRILGPISVYIDNEENIQSDITPPTGSIINPPSSGTVSGFVNIQVEAYDNHKINNVRMIIDGSFSIIDNEYPFEYNWDTTNETEDSDHFISATVTDSSGNTTNIMPVSVFVNNETDIFNDINPPYGVITSPAASQILSGSVLVNLSASDNVGISRVDIFQNDILSESLTELPYQLMWDTSLEIDDTNHRWYAKIYDTSNLTYQTVGINVTVDNNDNINPYGYIAQPYAGQIVSDSVDILFLASDNIGILTKEVFIDGILKNTITDSTNLYVWNTDTYSEDQEHYLSIKITDLSGNIFVSVPIAVLVNNIPDAEDDSTPPVISILSPVSYSEVSDSTLISIFAVDNIGINNIRLQIDTEAPIILNEYPYQYNWNTFEYDNNSQHIISAIATDMNGNETSAQSIVVTINNLFSGFIENIISTPDINSINLTWSSLNNATSYKIYKGQEFIFETTELSYLDNDVNPGIVYCYKIAPINQFQIEGILSETVCEKALISSPSDINGISDSNSISLTWDSVPYANQYKLYRNGNSIYIGTNPGFEDTSLSFNTSYFYNVSSIDETGDEGPQSDDFNFTTHFEINPPIISLSMDTTSFNLNWTMVSNAIAYRIYKNESFLVEVQQTNHEITINDSLEHCFYIKSINQYDNLSNESNIECGIVN